ncbi:MAG: hypothetical protein U5K51_13940 [Flavobacteriaceae bacterium]|nr:hypothetical protein [Flavobacteriaceae bacterium]
MNGQQKNESDFYKWFDENLGIENSILFNGTRPLENTISKDGSHKFYLIPTYIPGNIVYQSQPYFDIPLKYDIHEDEITINLIKNKESSIIRLIKANVQSFTLQNKQFVQLADPDQSVLVNGFYEVLFESSNLSLFKKHHKIKKEQIVQKQVYTNYKENDLYLMKKLGKYHNVANKNELIKIMPEHKSTINNFYKQYDKLRDSDLDAFLIKLCKNLSGSN